MIFSLCLNPWCGFDLWSTCFHSICQKASAEMTCLLKQDWTLTYLEWLRICGTSVAVAKRWSCLPIRHEQCVDSDKCSLMATATDSNDEEEHCSAGGILIYFGMEAFWKFQNYFVCLNFCFLFFDAAWNSLKLLWAIIKFNNVS